MLRISEILFLRHLGLFTLFRGFFFFLDPKEVRQVAQRSRKAHERGTFFLVHEDFKLVFHLANATIESDKVASEELLVDDIAMQAF